MDSNDDFDVLHLQDMLDEYASAMTYSRYTHATQTRRDIVKHYVAHHNMLQGQIDELILEIQDLRDECNQHGD